MRYIYMTQLTARLHVYSDRHKADGSLLCNVTERDIRSRCVGGMDKSCYSRWTGRQILPRSHFACRGGGGRSDTWGRSTWYWTTSVTIAGDKPVCR